MAYDAMLEAILPRLHVIMTSLAAHPTPEHLLLQKMILKIFYRSVEVWLLLRMLNGQPTCTSM